MKLFTGCWALFLGLILAAGTAEAQIPAPQGIGEGIGGGYRAVSDLNGPYGVFVPPEAPPYAAAPPQAPPYAAMPPELPGAAYGPALLPPAEVYAILGENGFRPLGVPRQRGMFYVIGVIDRYGEEGRLLIDARTGQIVRFVPAYRMGDLRGVAPIPYAPPGQPPSVGELRDPRSPAPAPKMASRAPVVPLPKAAPPRTTEDRPLAERPASQPPQQSAAVQMKPVDAPGAHVAPAVTEARPAGGQIQPTQPMPGVQGME